MSGGRGIGGDVAEDGEGLGMEVGVDGWLAGCVDALDGGGCLFVGGGLGDGDKFTQGEVVGLADLGWGYGGVEEVFEDEF